MFDVARGVARDMIRPGRHAVTVAHHNLASLASVRTCAAMLLETRPKIDLLINCAGINTRRLTVSPHGHDLNWAVNYLRPLVLTTLLLKRIRASEPACIVNLSLAMVRAGCIDFDDLQLTRGWTDLEGQYVGRASNARGGGSAFPPARA
ncbi:MAG: hypothetical protein OXI73_04850 [Rhodospirillales bacterium]|nr:hypothetical protein [Rhodospirillales bacterium]